MATRCMKWTKLLEGYGYCSIDVGKLKKLEQIESIMNGKTMM